MGSKNQRLARKRFKETHGDGQKPQNDSSMEKKKSNKKKKKKEGKRSKYVQPTKFKKQSNSQKKHPLRVPGMRPGDSCFICKGMDHLAKFCPTKDQWEKNKICLLCRQRGHSLKHCPKNDGTQEQKVCYNCGETGHSLFKCSRAVEDGGTKFAECFICKERGHLSKNCPRNTHGIYPKGGCCKVCGGITHLAKDCPNKGRKFSKIEKWQEGAKSQRTVFTSGDDLEDDFVMEESKQQKTGEFTHSQQIDSSRNVNVNQKKQQQGSKIVNFT